MSNTRTAFLLALYCLVGLSQARAEAQEREQAQAQAQATVQAFVQAFNNKAIEQMLMLCDDAIRWMWVDQNQLLTETEGKRALRQSLAQNFAGFPDSQSTIVGQTVSGNFVSAVERASWLQNGQPKTQCSMAIYELKAEKILNVWYYPAHHCE